MVDILMGGNTQMYYLNGRIDYNEIVTMPRRTTEPPPPPCYDDGMDQCAMFMKYVMYTCWSPPYAILLSLTSW